MNYKDLIDLQKNMTIDDIAKAYQKGFERGRNSTLELLYAKGKITREEYDELKEKIN